MRIDGWQVDGFGALKDFSQQGLGPGVTVLCGENEAGKTTLLAFVRAVLFGFPRANAKDERSYPPLRGGRHGGTLVLRDRSERLWTVARYAEGSKEAQVVRPDGSAGTAADLADLLGHADAQLFKSVFAFGLDELQQFESLTGEGVRDRIFSVGISGAGKSAREAIAKLTARQAELLKQRAGDAAMNNVVREIIAVGDQITAARGLVAQYGRLGDEVQVNTQRAEQLQEDADEKQRLRTELERFITLRPQWDDLAALRLELAGLPAPADPALPNEVAGAVTELAVQRDREQALDGLEAARAAAGAALADSLARLGPGWDVVRAQALDTSVPAVDQVHGWANQLTGAAQELGEAERDAEKAAADEALARAEAGRIRDELPAGEPLALAAIDAAEAGVAALRSEVGRLEALKLTAERDAVPDAPALWPVWLLAGLAAAGAAVAFVAGYAQAGIGLLVAAVLVGLAAVLTRSRRRVAPGGQPPDPGVIQRLEAEVKQAARDLALPEAPSSADMAALEARMRTERTRRSQWDAIQNRIRDAEGRVAEQAALVRQASAQSDEVRERLDALQTAWAAWQAPRGLSGLSADGVLQVMEHAKAVAEARARLESAAGSIAAIEQQATDGDAAGAAFLRAAGRSAEGLSREGLRNAVEVLHQDLGRRTHVLEAIAALERAVTLGLSAGNDPQRARRELAEGDVDIWTDKVATLGEEVRGLRDERDAALGAARDAATRRHEIEESADVPRLQEELESLRAQLAALRREYRVVSAARALVADTLRVYVRDRQPAVLEAGSQAFAAVTGGRYTGVEQDGDGALESVVVIPRDGGRLTPDQLSKGTQQQLYLSVRLALAELSAGSAEALPLIMDDCLVNFDPARAAALARLLAERAADGQALLFTCHPETADLMAQQTAGPVTIVQMPAR